MFLRAGALSLALLLASRLTGLLRESAQAAAFGASGLADIVVLMLALPDWLTGVLVSGALSYVLLPLWARQDAPGVAAVQRVVARWLVAGGAVLGAATLVANHGLIQALAPGVPERLQGEATLAMTWSAAALPLALLASLWGTRLQHERDFVGLYAANLVVNAMLVLALLLAAFAGGTAGLAWAGAGLVAAMVLRLAWLARRLPRVLRASLLPTWPGTPVWLWAALAAGLPLALPFAARSLASQGGEGALATFNYAWKLVELPLVLAIQLVAALAFPAVAGALTSTDPR